LGRNGLTLLSKSRRLTVGFPSSFPQKIRTKNCWIPSIG
jgi:hypothetical protein